MKKTIRIGTRDSELALWQASTVKKALENLGHSAVLVAVKSEGDLNLDQPLYEMGITGIFTKTLDLAMITGKIDIAVHSMKDVPTALPKGIVEAAILKRANSKDILLYKDLAFLDGKGTIATGSLRRKAQWLHKYPDHNLIDLRGNVNTRINKLENSNWNGAIFAAAGLERINLTPANHLPLDWMIPAPAQGAMLVVAMENDSYCLEALSHLNHKDSETCVHVERDFLRVLEGGCTAPIGAYAYIKDNTLHFQGALFSLDGQQNIQIEKSVPLGLLNNLGRECALEILHNGGEELMKNIKKALT